MWLAPRPQTQKGRMLIYYCCRLRAAVTIRAVEVNGRDAMFVKGVFECGAVIHRSGCVMSHTFTVAPLSVRVWGNRCATLEQEMLSLRGWTAMTRKPGCSRRSGGKVSKGEVLSKRDFVLIRRWRLGRIKGPNAESVSDANLEKVNETIVDASKADGAEHARFSRRCRLVRVL
jgi:hypothetical protein